MLLFYDLILVSSSENIYDFVSEKLKNIIINVELNVKFTMYMQMMKHGSKIFKKETKEFLKEKVVLTFIWMKD